jgi:hypothetical protein
MNCDNAAFDPEPALEVARILRALADRIEGATPYDSFPLQDANGNTIGAAEFLSLTKRKP